MCSLSGDDGDSDRDDSELPHNWINLVQGPVIKFGRNYAVIAKVSNGLLADSYWDWLKTWRCFEAEFPHRNAKGRLYNTYVMECRDAWLTLGGAFGYADRLFREQYECAYPRCQGASAPDSHREEWPRLWDNDA
ncbi:hypothetical protein FRC07_012022 [Ceratobasidium sp. 392]|nr:hypothetical protein FRC07_012022 [Ceratobasidium sp. 392]